ncbi:hypothetical protein VM1G_11075 [Cytospora mali]|uniref:Uncharacterized protein n=1 Tax=Cytospora mali TaxID=578113 RepID=A0A194VJW6_CYTMA|nr:hypothetical protein VM1G_11075 [Valsa mali]
MDRTQTQHEINSAREADMFLADNTVHRSSLSAEDMGERLALSLAAITAADDSQGIISIENMMEIDSATLKEFIQPPKKGHDLLMVQHSAGGENFSHLYIARSATFGIPECPEPVQEPSQVEIDTLFQ